jgi:hypothetical protein
VAAAPSTITPNGDGQADTALVSYTLTTPANVTVEVVDTAGTGVATVVDRVWTRAGAHTASVDGAALPDGQYAVVIRARTTTSPEVTAISSLVVSRTLGLVSVTPQAFSPNGDGRLDRLDVRFALTAPATVRVRIFRDDAWIASPFVGSLAAGAQRVLWDGSKRLGRIRDGSYSAVVEVTDAIGTVSFGVPFVSDTVAPRVRMLPGRRLRIDVSEPAVLKLWVNGQPLRREVERPGVVLIRWPEPVTRARVVAWDDAGNASVPAVRREDPGRPGQ